MNDLEQRTQKTKKTKAAAVAATTTQADKQIMTTRENVASRLSKLMLNNSNSNTNNGSSTAQAATTTSTTTTASTTAASMVSMVQSPQSPGEQSELNQLKRDADPQFSRFADYFVICGLDLDTGLEPDRFAGDNLHCSPLDRAYKSKPLAHYPEHVTWNPFDAHGICMLSLPQGLRFRTQKHNIEPKFHSFATTREDGKRCYGFSLVFYEEIRNRNICGAIHTLQSMFITELSNGQQTHSLSRVKDGPVSRSLPRHFKVAGQAPQSAQSYYDISKDKLFVAKSISLICQAPYAFAAQLFLKNLYRCLPRQPGAGISLESYVYNILYEVMLPQPGKSIRVYLPPMEPHLAAIALILQRPSLSTELPLLDFPLRLLFSYLGVECVIQLLTCVLLESQVLLRSTDYQRLMIVGECITSLLFPFVWPHVYAPILPAALHHFLDAPVPFVMGLHAECEAAHKIGSEAALCFVDIDKKHIQLPEELPIFPHKMDFMAEIISVLDKFEIERDRAQEPNLKNGYGMRGGADAMISSCTLPNGLQAARRSKERFQQLQETVYTLGGPGGSPGQLPGVDYQPLVAHPSKIDHVPRIADFLRRKGGMRAAQAAGSPVGSPTMSLSSSPVGIYHDVDAVDATLPPSRMGSLSRRSEKQKLSAVDQYYQDLRINNSLREIFLNRFAHMFHAYEYFVIYPNQAKDEWLSNRETLQNFDKSSFLSDQPEHHRAFLARFLESQMFATLIDNKILAMWEPQPDEQLQLFDQRIKLLRRRHGENMICATSYEPCVLSQDAQQGFEKRLNCIDIEVTPPSEILSNRAAYFRSFPLLEKGVLNQECASRGNSLRRVKNGNKWRAREISLDQKPTNSSTGGGGGGSNSNSNVAINRLSANLTTADVSPALIAQANWTFVERLLKDIKSKTKRMLLEKMGNEAVALGLKGDGIEENTLIASMCDLLEKIWSHGLQNKQGKSALWAHLQAYIELQEARGGAANSSNNVEPSTPVSSSPSSKMNIASASPALAWNAMRKRMDYLSTFQTDFESPPSPNRSRSRDRNKFVGLEQLCPLPESLEFDVKNVLAMADIKTHIGYTRAWVRLSLEKKLLSRHFRTLLSDESLLRSLYKRSAFLRCEEEKEQFLYHLLTLNTVDYFSFTNIYPTTKLPYRVVIFPSRKYGSYHTSSNVWIMVSGTMNETQRVPVPKGSLEFIFHYKNLGLLTTMRIGHDNSGQSHKWLVEQVVMRNEVTGHTYKFPCGRWLGKGVDDDSTERLLVGQRVSTSVKNAELVPPTRTPPRTRSPSVQRQESIAPSEIQHQLGNCVNVIVKWHYKPSRDRDVGTLTNLLCGDDGLVKCLEQVFLCGFRSSRFFGRNLYIWDYFTKIKELFEQNLQQELDDSASSMDSSFSNGSCNSLQRREVASIWRLYVQLMDEINGTASTLGKDGKFQLLICLSLREHLLTRLIKPMALTKVTQEMYEEESFLRRRNLLTFLIQILEPLDDCHIVLENSITQGIRIPSQC
ncbi:DENN domain-containing protein 5B isoform X1 [Drosophila sulfurigaster albostrigata]|uniref:DENN domain-containing protein 5B isoform X1 n=1 Tax=Drosophila sulfurigaster albostrigata TaxID=89887 RepID=UPI002D21953D|nr:DENN domain-containing protein 5B isoform X1 [Drosophila sulfurigaster albostrigata]XP_062129940.1 DENN domain-containing protein 5B isoform X1 [Drosophila sulfurigaster albostrigata]XP_062129941.1 DENN domain-containing protein 5B isoform X1 [Drosophila sulfurigaster albostrigata]XP_062129942.1 DENN domain-containing protein 5B isoform X1 [Drosophila sulfurigaster albostrigata]